MLAHDPVAIGRARGRRPTRTDCLMARLDLFRKTAHSVPSTSSGDDVRRCAAGCPAAIRRSRRLSSACAAAVGCRRPFLEGRRRFHYLKRGRRGMRGSQRSGDDGLSRYRRAQRNAAEDRALRLSGRAGFRAARSAFRASSPTIRACPAPARTRSPSSRIDGHFKGLLDELNGPEFRHADRGQVRHRPPVAADHVHGARRMPGDRRQDPHRFHHQAHHRAALHEREMGQGRRAAAHPAGTAPTSTTTSRRSRRMAARFSSSAARKIPGTGTSRSTGRAAPSR